jgi:hypothetical protein
MARRPFFSGNYGSALGSTAQAADIIARAGQQRGQALAGRGAQIGGMIQQYGLNKEKRDKSEAAFRADITRVMKDNPEQLASMQSDPVLGPTLKRIQEGKGSQKDFDKYHAYRAADKEATIEKLKMDNAETQQGMLETQARVEKQLADPKVRKALAEASSAEARSVYAGSIASAEYAARIQDNALKSAQTAHQELLTKALENKEQYTPGQVVDIEGPSGEKVRFYYSGETLQPLNDGKYIKDINKAIIQGVDPAELEAYIDRTYDVVDGQLVHKKDTKFGFGDAPKKNPLMEQAIAILALYDVDKKDSAVSKEPTPTAEATIDEHKSANEEAKSRGKMFYILNGKKFTVQ